VCVGYGTWLAHEYVPDARQPILLVVADHRLQH
jgi:hypothetical protein